MNMKTQRLQRKNNMEFGMQIARHSIRKEINNGCHNNLVISPLLLHISLNMLASGSTGRTLKQLLGFLETESISDLNAQSSIFMELATSGGRGPVISLANGIWVYNSFPVKPAFKQLAEDVYKAKVDSFDFVNQGEQIRDEVNSWARKTSKGHIDRLLPYGFFRKDAIAVLASEIYFNGTWVKKFPPQNTKNGDFHLLNGETVRVPFMREYSTKQLYGSFESFQLLKMEYENGESDSKKYAMYIFLPHKRDGLEELVQKFHSEPRFLLENREVSEVELEKLWLPKMKYEYKLNVVETMKELGLKLPFDETKAEITEMVETQVVFVSKATQKAYIELHEEGTIATAIDLGLGSIGSLGDLPPPPPQRPKFLADHPFLFMIKEEVSDIILFVGAAVHPSSDKGAGKKRKMKSNETDKKNQKDQKKMKNIFAWDY